ncbi:hypothetical protein IWQ47_000065 [Aquimarina sp. EL_43]|uniref:hypothetical protein n=1 Tax=unclassified Aquimarina TaxID=2627091 RepID=UPI0018C9C42E|nr:MULTISPECIES: hypothetical protein [unclassified Aquimarina]MBG6129242.1 hypothetical protein [Aquimarina sp. EL_35]MBG6150307.1 hypothetical protein [Aquimarina sp. EL_32]MBG6167007.1 hypothetical protein [Aquimarina sp. EL_43]
MKKTILKIASILMLTIFIGSCEKKDSNLDIYDHEMKEVPSETVSNKRNENNKATNVAVNKSSKLWKILKYVPGKVIVENGQTIPEVGVNIIAEGYHPNFLFWIVDGCFEIVGSDEEQKVTIKRVNKNEGHIYYTYMENNNIMSNYRKFVAIPPDHSSTPCPTSEHTKMRQSFSTYTAASNYDERYTYNWTVVNKGSTYHGTGSNIRLRGYGNFNVTLTVTLDGCTTQTRTQNFYVNIGR